LVEPQRLHLTLGVVHLSNQDPPTTTSSSVKTVASALALLKSLRPRLLELAALLIPQHDNVGHVVPHSAPKLMVPLEVMDTFQNVGKGHTQANVLYVGPPHRSARASHSLSPGESALDVLWMACRLIESTFRQNNYILDARPLKLHLTLANTQYRTPRSRSGHTVPFAYDEILCALHLTIPRDRRRIVQKDMSGDASETNSVQPNVPLNWGAFAMEEIQLCVMGSRDGSGRYVSVGGVRLS